MPTTYALLSTYPPTQCGLAAFSAALLAQLPGPGDSVAVMRVLGEPQPCFTDEVVHDLVNGSAVSTAAAARILNGFDVVIVQHEYGSYGGPDGQDIMAVLWALHVPSIVVLHTVLAHPTSRQRTILDEIIAAATVVVTMTQTARSRLLDIYGTSPGKGIEHAIDAIALLPGRGAGLLVKRQDPAGIAHALRRVLTEPGLSARMSGHSADLAPHLLWPAVASAYRELASALTMAPAGATS